MKLLHRFFAWNDRRRAREYLQHVCDERLAARLKLEEADRKADRALQDAQKLEVERFREEFFCKRNALRSAFIEGSAKLLGITNLAPFVVEARKLSEIGPTKYTTWSRSELTRKAA